MPDAGVAEEKEKGIGKKDGNRVCREERDRN
jgi:hypothetical protein